MWKRLRVWTGRSACFLLVVVAVPLGAAGAVVGFFGAALFASSVPILALSGALALVFLTGGLSLLASRRLFRYRAPRRWVPLFVTVGTLLVVGVAAGALVFRPMDVSYVPQEPTDRTRYWDLPTGSRLAYELTPAEGKPRPTPVVMLHGGPGTPGELTPEPEDRVLAEAGFDVYRYDQVGAGLSSRLEDVSRYTVGRHVADLEAIRKEIGAERLILVGGSWGATLAAHYLAAYPERVERTVVESPGAIWSPAFAEAGISEGPENEVIGEAVTPRFLVVMGLQQINLEAAYNFAPDREMSGFFQALVGRIIASDVAGCDARGSDAPTKPRLPEGFSYYTNVATAASVDRSEDPRPALKGVDVPVLVVRPECDRLRWEVAREYREVFPDATLVVAEGAGHSVGASRPNLYADLLRAFLLEEPLPLKPYRSDEAPE